MHVQHGVVKIPLRIRELAIDWPRSRDIRDIASPFLEPGVKIA